MAGAGSQYFFPGASHSPADVVYVVANAGLIFAWYWLDSRQRGYKRSPWLDVGVFGIAAIVLPYYFFRTRGAKGGVLASTLFLLLVLATGVLDMAAQYAVFLTLQT